MITTLEIYFNAQEYAQKKGCGGAARIADEQGFVAGAEWMQQKLQQTPVSGSLPPYDSELLKRLWTERNPQHETNADTGENMFWRTAFMVMADYMQLAGGNDR